MIDGASVLVTGGTGFFGTGFVKKALESNVGRICIYSRDEWKQAQMRTALDDDPRCRWFVGDVRDEKRLRRAMDGVDLVVHAAALKRVEVGENNPREMVQTNVIGTMNVIEAATDAGVKKVVSLSTDKACNPCTMYGASKLAGEKLILAANNTRGSAGPIFAACRYGNVAGSTGSIIPAWRAMLATSDMVRVTDPDCTRYWMRLEDAVNMVLWVSQHMIGGELVVPDLKAYRVGDLAEAMGAKMGVVGLGAAEKKHEAMLGPDEISGFFRCWKFWIKGSALSYASKLENVLTSDAAERMSKHDLLMELKNV